MAGKPKFTVEQVAKALNDCKGMVYLAAKQLKCHHQTVFNYLKRHASLRDVVESNRGEMVDFAELVLWKALQNGEQWAVVFTLTRLGKDRGYNEKIEHRHEHNYRNLPDLSADEFRQLPYVRQLELYRQALETPSRN
jgi:hypothetical protein